MTAGEATMLFTVTPDDTALAVGSGSLPVLGTPRLLAWLEAATCAAIEASLPEGSTSVGTRMEIDHQAPSALGQSVQVNVTTVHVDGRLHRFSVAARHLEPGASEARGPLVASGEITRVVVDATRFMERLA